MVSTRNANGILAVPASVTSKKANMSSSATNSSPKAGVGRLRLIIRRLPPGLTEAEFKSALGDEWRVGAGKADWFAYKDGKITKDSAKPSRPARAYLRVKDQGMLDTLSAAVKECNFQDAKNTSKDPCLLGPPSLEFAPYGKIPGSRVRKDGRQGTIDQDPEFIDFLQSLTEPVTRFNGVVEGTDGTDAKPAKVTTTPLVEYLKEKKANKGKESTPSKNAKSQVKPEAKETKEAKEATSTAKEAKVEKLDPKKVPVVKKEVPRPLEKAKVEKATQETGKAVTKSGSLPKHKSDLADSASPSSKAPATTQVPAKRERERPSASGAARILQRDLGLLPPRGDRRTSRVGAVTTKAGLGLESERKTVPDSVAVPSANEAPEPASSGGAATPSLSSSTGPIAPPTGPRISKVPLPTSQPVNRPATVPSVRPSRSPPKPSAGAKSAFLKHANFSQGVTEEPLLAVFSAFGVVVRCEIDRKKGFGYVDFEDPESLKKAMLASPVKVGDKGGQVVVLENKNTRAKPQISEKQSAPTESTLSSPSQTPPTMVTKLGEEGAAPMLSTTTATTTTTAVPTAPRGAQNLFRGGAQHHGPRGGNLGPPRGPTNRAGRGGRTSFRGRGTSDTNRGGSGRPNGQNQTAPVSAPVPIAPVSVSTAMTSANNQHPTG